MNEFETKRSRRQFGVRGLVPALASGGAAFFPSPFRQLWESLGAPQGKKRLRRRGKRGQGPALQIGGFAASQNSSARPYSQLRFQLLAALLFLVCSASELLAFQETPPAKPEQPKPTRKDSVDDELLKKLVPDLAPEKKPDAATPADKTQDELDRTVQSMRSVSKKLSQKDVSEETRRQQKSIIDDINALIEKLKQPPPDSSQSQSSNNQDQQQNQSKSQDRQSAQQRKEQQQQQREQQEAQQKQKQAGTGEGSSQQSVNKSAEASDKEQQRKAAARAAELAKRRALIDEVWGHLPPALREKMLNVGNENLLPQYEDVIRRYYEAIALPPEGDKRPGTRKPNNAKSK